MARLAALHRGGALAQVALGIDAPAPRHLELLGAELPAVSPLSAEEVETTRAIGDNTGSMLLKGATPDHDGEEAPDRWTLGAEQVEVAERWGIDPERDLRKTAA